MGGLSTQFPDRSYSVWVIYTLTNLSRNIDFSYRKTNTAQQMGWMTHSVRFIVAVHLVL